MQWQLFAKVMVKLAEVRSYSVERDAPRYASHLLTHRSDLFAQLEGGPRGVPARLAADIIARDHMREICALPQVVESIQNSMDNSTMSASERLVRLAALAYLVCDNDILPDDLPAGSGLIDDCITLRGARLATSTVLGTDYFAEDLVQIHYLSAAVPPRVLPTIESVLVHAATIAFQTRSLPDAVIEIAIRELIEHPPDHFPPGMALPDLESMPTVESPLHLVPAQVISATRTSLVIEFPDIGRLRRTADGGLNYL